MRYKQNYNRQSGDNTNLLIFGAIGLAAVTILICVSLFACSDDGASTENTSSQAVVVSSDISSTDSSQIEASSDTESQVSSATENTIAQTGVWNRTMVKKENASVLSISDSNSSGFSFSISSTKGTQSSKVSGNARFTSTDVATCNINGATIIFTFQEDYITVSHDGDEKKLGCANGITHDGTFVKGKPEYVDGLTNSSYSTDIRKSTMCTSALKGCMTGNDYEKMNNIMENGTQFISRNDELTYDKDGKEINVDAEMKGVKYTYSLQGAGEHVFLICTNGGKVYVGLITEGEMRYYTNDPTYASTPPKSIQSAAKNYEVEIKYMSK